MPYETPPQVPRYSPLVAACAELLRIANDINELAATHTEGHSELEEIKTTFRVKVGLLPLDPQTPTSTR